MFYGHAVQRGTFVKTNLYQLQVKLSILRLFGAAPALEYL